MHCFGRTREKVKAVGTKDTREKGDALSTLSTFSENQVISCLTNSAGFVFISTQLLSSLLSIIVS